MSIDTKAHGLDGSLVEPDWPPLNLNEVSALLRQFPQCGEPVEILSVSPRPFSAAGVVATVRGQVFVKRHHRTVRDREGLLEEHRFMKHLAANGAPVPGVYATDSGETVIESGVWTYEVHETPPGIDLYEDAISWTPFRSASHAYSAGRALATLHLAAQGFSAPRASRDRSSRAFQFLQPPTLRSCSNITSPPGQLWPDTPIRMGTSRGLSNFCRLSTQSCFLSCLR